MLIWLSGFMLALFSAVWEFGGVLRSRFAQFGTKADILRDPHPHQMVVSPSDAIGVEIRNQSASETVSQIARSATPPSFYPSAIWAGAPI